MRDLWPNKEHCLSTVDRKHQPWLVFAAHRVLGYSSNSWYAMQGSYEEPEGRESLQKLWQRYRVDIAFFGHVHNYERTCPMYQNQCMTKETTRYSGTMNGTIFVVAGGGGSHLSDYTTAIPRWSVFRDSDYGFVKLTSFNHSSRPAVRVQEEQRRQGLRLLHHRQGLPRRAQLRARQLLPHNARHLKTISILPPN
jgi:hypothetical protein